jgi:hypothetical protein
VGFKVRKMKNYKQDKEIISNPDDDDEERDLWDDVIE